MHCIGACSPLCLRLPEDGVSAPKVVRVIQNLCTVVILLWAVLGECG